jgi:hypothetical protein
MGMVFMLREYRGPFIGTIKLLLLLLLLLLLYLVIGDPFIYL